MGFLFKRAKSFEALFWRFVALTVIVMVLLIAVILILIDAKPLLTITVLVVAFVPFVIIAWKVYTALSAPLKSLAASLEAIRHEEYTLRTQPKFSAGAIKAMSEEVSLIADDLKARKINYDRQAVLVFNLIEQLATPIAVFDSIGCLHHGNDALSTWCGIPWRQARQCKAQQLGLRFNTGTQLPPWEIEDKHRAQHWQLRYSAFELSGERYQLVVMTNVEQLIKSTEREAWQKMTRVLSHEINNSMAPIKSLAESLLELLGTEQQNPKISSALEVIINRSGSLMGFVDRYASLNQVYEPDIKSLDIDVLINKVAGLFECDVRYKKSGIQIQSDEIMLEQVLINLLKNATEASPKGKPIEISVKKINMTVKVLIKDQGPGIANIDNLFVPFYTTKANGKGIGLSLCRNILEQLNGRLELKNRDDRAGAEAVINLPSRIDK
ncbi:ATP-binding protein [Alteromonas sp. KUL49]|uniref:sensor histidine kinase n=1 Tax=Alteromonas sp. KUL49 TaxID=2480798 RepID=UPI00102EE194|nr:ATP-binding protein [Alteromonas sp. KUL49]TAP41514.1 GHKL domain-containing protein [Alteromonas sp. KUL49]GEA10607.1 sensor histidine kinase [Alteromonas sp. KUL49]